MPKGDQNSVAVIPQHEKGKVLTAKYLTDLEGAVRGRTPLKGVGIDILYIESGSIISVTGPLSGVSTQTLTICSNGTPAKIKVLVAP